MANHHSIPHPHYHLPPHPAHPPYPHPPPPGTPLATNGSAASPVPAAMATPAARGAPTAAPAPVIPHPASQLPALQKLAQANEQTWLLIGTVAEQMNDLDRALAAYEHAIRHNPHSIAGLTNIAGIARARENYSTASPICHCFLMKDDLQNAYSAYQQALYYLPNPKLQDPKLWYGIGILYDRYGSLEHAEEAFSSVLRMDKDFDKADEIFFRLGIIYKQQQKYEEALKCFERIHRNPPAPLTNIDIWFQIGHVYEQMKDYTAAKDAYERVLKDSPNHAKVLQQLGWLYHQAGAPFANQDTAIVLLTKSLESDPADPQSWYLLGRAYMAGQKYQKAYESYQQAVYRDGRNPTFWCSIGVLYYNINQFRDALDAYSRAIRINPYISEVWFDLGSLYESCNNQISDAIDAYARAAELDPGNPHITQRLNLLRNVQANGGTLPAAPGPQDIHPTAYAGGGPMNPMHTPVGPPPPLTGGPASGSVPPPRPARPDSRGPLPDAGSSRELPALGINAPNARGASPPFHAPPPLQLDEGSGRGSSTRLPQMAPMDIDRAPPPPSSLFRSQSQGPNANPNQLPPPPAIAAGASYPDVDRRTRSPSPRLPPPGNYPGRPGLNSHGQGSSYSSGYLNGEPAWERERGGREREREREREARDRESDRESRSSRQRQPSVSERVKVEILNQQAPPDRFFPGRGGPSSPVASRYDPRRSPPPAERPPEGRSPYMAAPAHPGGPYPGYWERERERERGAPPKVPSRQHSPAPRDRESLAPSSSRRYDPRMDIDQEPPRREYWPEDQAHPAPHPVDRDRYSATPDGSRRSNRGPEAPPHGSESPIPGGSSRAPVPEPMGKTARRRGAQAAAAAPPREQQAPPPHPKEKKERKPPTKRGGRESSAVPPEREMSAPAPRAPGSAPVSQAGPPQHSTFKVTLGDSNGNTLPPPLVPGAAGANHHRSQSGSNGSARSRATPSPTMGPPRREVDEDYDEGVADALMGLSGLKSQSQNMRARTASIHSVASPGPHGPASMGGRHEAFAPPVTRSPPVSTSRPSPPFSRPASALPPHPSSPQSVRNASASNRSPPSSFARRGSEQPRDKTPLSLKRGMDDEASGPLEKRHRVDVLNHPVPTVFPPPPSTDARSSPNMSLGRRFDPVMSSVADTRMETDSPKGEPALPPIATLPPPPDSPPRKGGDGDDVRSASERSGTNTMSGITAADMDGRSDDVHVISIDYADTPQDGPTAIDVGPTADFRRPVHTRSGSEFDPEARNSEPSPDVNLDLSSVEDATRNSEPSPDVNLDLSSVEDASGSGGGGGGILPPDFVHPLAAAQLAPGKMLVQGQSQAAKTGSVRSRGRVPDALEVLPLEEHTSTTRAPRRVVPHSSYYNGPPPLDSAYGSDPLGQIGVHYPREILRIERDYSGGELCQEILRIERDYSGGELCQFHPTFPLELEGRITPVQHQESMNSINEVLISAHSLFPSFVYNSVAILTLYISTLFVSSHYDKEMRRLRLLIDQLNREVYNPQGLNILWPQRTAFLFLEIEYY
ncbi:unnamed protein product [Rhizoctonia solani]|uniref:Golgin subfamily A member 7/ERF4 domain-containing protein n=1 Tax=Rhizoctonia solani TaxID=456999 RepID=A0A8H3HLX5_9AGAM|nr:unnamed protein product [Rhizoctonia solani]